MTRDAVMTTLPVRMGTTTPLVGLDSTLAIAVSLLVHWAEMTSRLASRIDGRGARVVYRGAMRWGICASLALIALVGCKEEPPFSPEARVYADEGARLGDVGARQLESAAAKELGLLYAARASMRTEVTRLKEDLAKLGDAGDGKEAKRLLAAEEKKLADVEPKIAKQRKVVEGNRDKLVALKKETEALLADKKIDAGVSRSVLEARLTGVEASLVETNAALAGEHADAG